MPRKFWLATTAAAALLGAASLGAAQNMQPGGSDGANGMHSQHEGGGVQEGPGRGQAGVQENRGASEQRGENNTRMQSDRNREMGAGKSTERNERTGAGNEERSQRREMGAGNREEMQRNNQRSEENTRTRNQRSDETGERHRERGGVNHEGTGPGRAQSNEGINRNGPGRAQSNEGMGQRSEQEQRFESARSVRLSNEQRTKIRDTFTHEHVQRVEHPDFALRVGTPVPRGVQLYDVPEEIVTVVPEYRGLKYIIVRNDVVFLDPYTLRIVAIMPA
jgi:hypothetical protein